MSKVVEKLLNIKRIHDNLVITVPGKWNELTIEKIMKDYWRAPKKLIHEWRMSKKVTINGETAQWTKPLLEDDLLGIPIFEFPITNFPVPKDLRIDILYEDDHLLIANKRAGMETHPAKPEQNNTLLNGVAYHLSETNQQSFIKHIHRLDKDTTGAVLFAKNPFVGAILDRMLEERTITRTYIALAEGPMKNKQGRIDAKIGRDRHHATRRRVSPTGQTAITHYKVLKFFPEKNVTMVSCTLESGRTHQIRVHFSHIHHPLAGDTLYGGKKTFPRQALHARKIAFLHPMTEENLSITAPYLDEPPIFT